VLFADESEALTHSYLAHAWTKRSAGFIALLRRLDHRYAPQPNQTARPVVLVIRNSSIHRSKASRTAPPGQTLADGRIE
jgi:hypothetical protein